jgi:predicted enzyme related to lactoylglutathione lyase
VAGVSLNLIVLRAQNPERTAHFYGLLGIAFERERHGDGPEHLAGRVGSVTLEIYPPGGEADTVGVRLGFRVPSVDAVVQAVRQAGGTVVSPARQSPWGYRAVLADPDGRRVEVTEEVV